MDFLWGNVINKHFIWGNVMKKAHFPHKLKKKNFLWYLLNILIENVGHTKLYVQIGETEYKNMRNIRWRSGPIHHKGAEIRGDHKWLSTVNWSNKCSEETLRAFIHSPKICQRVTHSVCTVLKILNDTSKTLYILMGSERQEVYKQVITNTAYVVLSTGKKTNMER